jgi:hypothetical protein
VLCSVLRGGGGGGADMRARVRVLVRVCRVWGGEGGRDGSVCVTRFLHMARLHSPPQRPIAPTNWSALQAWCDLCGYRADEAIGKTLSMIQGTGTDRAQLRRMMHDVKHACASSATITNYRKDGSSFLNYVRVYPLTNDEGGATSGTAPSHYLGVLESLTIAGA